MTSGDQPVTPEDYAGTQAPRVPGVSSVTSWIVAPVTLTPTTGHGGGEYSADGLAESVAWTGCLWGWAGYRREEPAGINGRGAGLPEPKGAEDLDQAHCLALRADGDEVSDLASEACVPADDLAIADDGRAKSFAEEDIDEVVQCRGAGMVAFGLRRPVHVVVHDDWPADVRGQNLDGIEVAEQERLVGQLSQPSGGPVHRTCGAHDGQAKGQPGAVLSLDGGGLQRVCNLLSPGWRAGPS